MALLTVHTPFNIDLQFSLAAFHKRLFAWLLDFFFITVYSYVVVFIVVGTFLSVEYEGREDILMGQWVLLFFLIGLPVMLYHFLFEWLWNGQSPGKKIIGLQVRNAEGASATFSQYVLRWMFFIPNFMIPAGVVVGGPFTTLGVLMIISLLLLPAVISIAVSKRSQRLGDIAAGTVVVDIKHKADISETIYIEVEQETYVPVFPQVLQLSDKDINGIRNLLHSKGGKEHDNYMLRVAYRIEEVLKIKMNGEPYQFLQTLLMDYNYLTQSR